MTTISNFHPARGRVVATFSAKVGDLTLPGCALIRRDDGYSLSVPRIGTPSRSAPLSAVELAELERVAVEMVEEQDTEDDDLAYLTKKYGGTFRRVVPRPLGVVQPDGSIGVRFIPIKDGLVVSEPDETNGATAKRTTDEPTDH